MSRGQHADTTDIVGSSTKPCEKTCASPNLARTRFDTLHCPSPKPLCTNAVLHNTPCKTLRMATYRQPRTSCTPMISISVAQWMRWYSDRMQALYLAKACVSKGCSSDVVPGGIQTTQIPARRQVSKTSLVKCTLHASINRTGWYLSAYGASAIPSCLMILQQRPELFHELFCRTRNTLAGARAHNSSNDLALKICVLPTTY